MPGFFRVRFSRKLPIFVNGGLTRWRINASYHGKNSSHLQVYATCETDPSAPPVKIADGRAGTVEGWLINGILAEKGTLAGKILSRAVRDGSAVVIPESEGAHRAPL